MDQQFSPSRLERKREAVYRYRRMAAGAVAAYKLEAGCADCGLKPERPEVLGFDHVRGVKLFNVSQMHKVSLPLVLEEIEKCDVVCHNCHAIRTADRRPAHG